MAKEFRSILIYFSIILDYILIKLVINKYIVFDFRV